MTKEEYISDHIPHRINLLITFRERFSPSSKLFIKPDNIRDFYRCSKDISMMMVRVLLGELGINFKREKDNKSNDISESWKPKYGIKQLTYYDVKSDHRYSHILKVLRAANRTVAHVEEKDINHPLLLDEDNQILFDAIDFTEEKIISHIYNELNIDYTRVMLNENNNMNRK